MGYQITFTPPKEKMETYKKQNNSLYTLEESINSTKRELVHFCLKEHDKMLYSIEQTIKYSLKSLIKNIKENEKQRAYERWNEDEDHQLWYCGWQFARENDRDEDEMLEYTIDKLALLADVVKTPNYFEESERFYDKWNEIKDEINGFIEIFEEIAIHEIIEDLREYEEKYDKEDEDKDEDISVEGIPQKDEEKKDKI